MKKALSILLCVVSVLVFCAFPFGMAVFADDIVSPVVNFGKDYIQNYSLPGIVYKYLNSSQKKLEAARSYYFYCITNDTFLSSCTVFDSSGIKFTDEILNFYYEQYTLACKGLSDVYVSDGDIYLSAAGFPDVPFSLRLLGFSTSNFSDFKNYYNTFLARYLLEQGETATDPNPGKSGLDIAPGYVTSEEFVEGIEIDNLNIAPKSRNMFVNSYRNDTNYFYNYPTNYYNAYAVAVTLFQDPSKKSTLTDLYCVPFYRSEDGIYYFQEYQLHFYFVPVEDTESGFDIALRVDTYKYNANFGYIYDDSISGVIFQEHNGDVFQVRFLGTSYYSTSSPSFQLVSTPVAYNNKTNTSYRVPFGSLGKYYTPDKSESLDISYLSSGTTTVGSLGFSKSYQNNPNSNNDIGFFCSSEMISCQYSCDTSQIPLHQVVTVNGGDTIYNYTITDPNTNDSSTFGDYITNNYTYITNNYSEGESSGSGSGVGGNVTVGGEIDVGGSVGVDINVSVPDININVNGNGGAGVSGTSIANPDDFTSADEVDLTKYYDNAVEQSTGFQKFLKDFFGFLPAELLALILFAVAMAIVCRVFGR